jgi:hypothetical protein
MQMCRAELCQTVSININTQACELTKLEEVSFRNKAVLAGFGSRVETQLAIWRGLAVDTIARSPGLPRTFQNTAYLEHVWKFTVFYRELNS